METFKYGEARAIVRKSCEKTDNMRSNYPDFLMHFGIKGQKWGIRRYQNEDGTLTSAGKQRYGMSLDAEKNRLSDKSVSSESKKMARAYNRERRKLNRFEKNADIDLQSKNAEKFQKQAKVAGGVAAALAGAAVGTQFGSAKKVRQDIDGWKAAYDKADKEASEAISWLFDHTGANATAAVPHMKGVADRAIDQMNYTLYKQKELKGKDTFGTAPVSDLTKGLAAGAAIAGGVAAYSAVRAKIANYRVSDIGHQKAVEKYEQQYNKMLDKFKDTPFEQLVKDKPTTNRESDYVRSCGLMTKDKKAMKEINQVIDQNPEAFKKLSNTAKEYQNASEALESAYNTFGDRLAKERGKAWDGDGTEMHFEMEKRYPAYKKISERQNKALKDLVEQSNIAGKSGLFSKSKILKRFESFFDAYDTGWFKSGDPKAYAIAVSMMQKANGKKFANDFFPEYFVEFFDSKTKGKIGSPLS